MINGDLADLLNLQQMQKKVLFFRVDSSGVLWFLFNFVGTTFVIQTFIFSYQAK